MIIVSHLAHQRQMLLKLKLQDPWFRFYVRTSQILKDRISQHVSNIKNLRHPHSLLSNLDKQWSY